MRGWGTRFLLMREFFQFHSHEAACVLLEFREDNIFFKRRMTEKCLIMLCFIPRKSVSLEKYIRNDFNTHQSPVTR